MVTVHWLIQANHPGGPFVARQAAETVAGTGGNPHLVDLVPRSPDIPPVEGLPPGAPVVCIGPGFVPRALARPEWRPGIHFSEGAFRWSAFRDGWGDRMLSREARVVSFDEACAHPGLFVRPDADSKLFDGGVYGPGELRGHCSRIPARILADTEVVVAPALAVDAEWRLFVVDGEVVDASSYRVKGRPSTEGSLPRGAEDLAREALGAWVPARAFCLDIGSAGGRLGIVEANCINASRLYAADPVRVYGALGRDAERTYGPAPPQRGEGVSSGFGM